MIQITVAQDTIRVISYTDKRTGKPAKFYVQTAYAHTVDKQGNRPPYPEKIELPLDRDEHGQPLAHPPGEYALHPSAIYVDRNGRLQVGVRLAPLKTKQAATANG